MTLNACESFTTAVMQVSILCFGCKWFKNAKLMQTDRETCCNTAHLQTRGTGLTSAIKIYASANALHRSFDGGDKF